MPELPLEHIMYALPDSIAIALEQLSDAEKSIIDEIRLRSARPLAVTVSGKSLFVGDGFKSFPDRSCHTVTAAEIEECFSLICGKSAFAHEEELKNGFVIMKNGCRAGIFGEYCDNGFVRISGINIRISRRIDGAADEIMSAYTGAGLLIAGPPASGKTTVLRDLILRLSSFEGGFKRVCVIDSRGELFGGIKDSDLSETVDIAVISDRGKGIEAALRTMYPEIIAFDEICTDDELSAVLKGAFTGARIITTAHIGSFEELLRRNITSRLLESGIINQVALLSKDRSKPPKIAEVV